jgi:hypothetical protein
MSLRFRFSNGVAALLAMAASMAAAEDAPFPHTTVLIEAEMFEQYGGWVADSQFIDQMGSSFLLAHGLGVPVADATTAIRLPAAGKFHIWVRTRDWVAPWKASGAPGRFQVLLDGKPLKTTFGTEGATWHWQDGGAVDLPAGPIAVALHDLTGLEGRCDAIVLSTVPSFTPPNEASELTAFRRKLLGLGDKPEDAGPFDLVVVGGGMAGTCAAVSAARLQLKVALVQDRPLLGGNNSSEVRVALGGVRNRKPYPRVGDVVAQLEQKHWANYGPTNTAALYEDDKKLALVRAEKNCRLLLCHRAYAVDTANGRITAVTAQDTRTGRRVRLTGRWFADCTGDGCIGTLAGADFEMTERGHMGPSNLWNVAETSQPSAFPRCPWALDLSKKPFPGRGEEPHDKLASDSIELRGDQQRGIAALGGWYWESGFDHTPIEKAEYIRDWNFRAMYGAWDALKNVDHKYPNHKLNWAAFVAGKRESRRLLGDVILSGEDVLNGRKYSDGCVPTGWPIDLHLPDPRFEKGFEGDAFISHALFTSYPTPYWVPYRCLYSRNVPNLFMAGRCVSVTHQALGTVRVMRTGGCMGEIVGMAASICRQRDCDPRDVYRKHFDEMKAQMQRGLPTRP